METLCIGTENDLQAHNAQLLPTGIVFIDSAVDDYESLMAGVMPEFAVFLLDATRNGVEQISDILSDWSGLSSLHIVSHGTPGSVQLGTGYLNLETINLYSGNLKGWANALTDRAEILFYGCEIAKGAEGVALVEQLNMLTGATIAASTTLVGSEAHAGNWQLDYATGPVQTALAISPSVQEIYQSVFAANDNFANRIVLNGSNITTTGDNIGATGEAGEPGGSGVLESVWWSWTAPASGSTVISTTGSSFDTYLWVYTGATLTSLSLIASDDDSGGSANSLVSINATAGVTYQIRVEGWQSGQGAITLNIAAPNPPTNHAPAGTDRTLTFNEDTVYTFSASDFGFSDPNDSPTNALSSVKITTIPAGGVLQLNGNAVSAGQFIAAADIANLTYTPTANANGAGYSNFTFQVQDNGGTASGGVDLDQTPNIITFNVNSVNDAPTLGSGGLAATIDTLPTWNGTSSISSFGEPNTATYGQTFTVPNGSNVLSSFSLYLNDYTNPDAIDFAFYVMAWDGVKATGPILYQSAMQTTTGASGFEKFTFNTGNLSVTSGQQYVAFISASNFLDMLNGDGTQAGQGNDPYSGGSFVFLNNGANFNALTTTAWENRLSQMDTTFTAEFGSPGLADQSATEDSLFSYQFASDIFQDVDAGDVLTYTTTLADGSALPTWLNFDAATRTFSGNPTNSEVGILSVKVTATDLAGASVSDTFDLTVANTNDAPTLDNGIGNQTATEDSPFSYTFAANIFSDVDAGDTLTYTATLADGSALPTWLNFDAATRNFSGTPTNNEVGILSVKVTATDLAGAAVDDIFDIAVANTNDAPIVTTPIATQTLAAYSLLNFSIPAGTFTDVDANDALTYTATLANGSPLPSWLTFNPGTQTFQGIANSEDSSLSIQVTATDMAGASVSNTFALDIMLPTTTTNNTINGTPLKDSLQGTANNDLINGLDDNDTIMGNAGDDTINGQGGNDILRGGIGGDILNGGIGSDQLFGDDGNDILIGGNGIDTLRGGIGNDILDGGTENDLLFGDDGNDTMIGGSGNDTLQGSNGDDLLYGSAGNDFIYGDAGSDTLWGGSGSDSMWGGVGSDKFGLQSGQGADTVRDFSLLDDVFVLGSGLNYGSLNLSQSGSNALIKVGAETLATVFGVQANLITASHFVM